MTKTPLILAIISLLGQTGCKEPDYTTVRLPNDPSGKLRGEAKVLSEGAFIRLSRVREPWNDAKPLIIGQCSNVAFYWAGANRAVIAYDKVEVQYFVGAPSWWSGAEITLCNRSSGTCPVPVSPVIALPNCDEHTM